MADTFQLQVATPERLVVDEQVTEAEVPGQNGYLGILPGHAPLMTALNPGVLTYQGGGGPHVLAIMGGFAEISENHVRVLADGAETPEEIQIDRARRQLEEASHKLHDAKDPAEVEIAMRALQQAQARIDATGRSSSSLSAR